jgi:hypothetical protein
MTAASRNLISGNGSDGVTISGGDSNEVIGNRIGTTASGTGPLGNAFDGVTIQGGSTNNVVGSLGFDFSPAGGTNTIAFNGQAGVAVFGDASVGNAIGRNSTFSNGGLGIDLVGGIEDAAGRTANDPGDADAGPNDLQNFPVLSSAKSSTTKTTIVGKLATHEGRSVLIQFFSNPSGNEGKKFIGQKVTSPDASGKASFTFSPATRVPVGQTVTATATDGQGNTSEFSAPRTVASS